MKDNTFIFQRYSKKENWSTNNTLMFFSMINQESHDKFQSIVGSLIDNSELVIGPMFKQQQQSPTKNSVPDGMIRQQGFSLYVESKTDSGFTAEQLINHIQGLEQENSENKILMTISIDPIPKEVVSEVVTNQKEMDSSVVFCSVTFKQIVEVVSENVNEYETKLNRLVQDYSAFCSAEGLINREDSTMLAVTASQSFKENLTYNLYYDPATRNHNIPYRYIGLYLDKKIQAIGELSKIVTCDLVGDQLVIKDDDAKKLSQEEYDRIKNVIENTPYYNLRKGSKFFLVDKFFKTEFIKDSNGPVRQKRYIFLDDFDGYANTFTAAELAEWLYGRSWD